MEAIKSVSKDKIQTGFSLDVKKMKLLLDPVFSTINTNTVLSILEDVLTQRENGQLSFSSTDLESIMTVSIPNAGEDFSCVFPGLELKYLLRNSLSNLLDSTISGDMNSPNISVKNDSFILNLVTSRVGDYPKPVLLEGTKSFSVETKEIIPYLGKALQYVSNDDLRPAMTGISFKDVDGMLQIAATDARRLYWNSVCKTPKSLKGCSFIVSNKAIRIMIQAFSTEHTVQIGVSENHFGVKCDGKKLVTRLIDSRYPEYNSVIPTDNALKVTLCRSKLVSLLKMCLPFTNFATRQLAMKVTPSFVEISGGNVDFATDFNSQLSIHWLNLDTFAPFIFGINCKFFLQAIEGLKTEFVEIKTSMSPTKAIIVDDCVLIMPLMLNA